MNHREILQALLDGKTLITACANELSIINDTLQYKYNEDGFKATVLNITKPELWKIKPKTININGFEVPEPVRKPLPIDTLYYRTYLTHITSFHWRDDSTDSDGLKLGLLHLTKEAAQIHLDALLSFTKLEDKDDN